MDRFTGGRRAPALRCLAWVFLWLGWISLLPAAAQVSLQLSPLADQRIRLSWSPTQPGQTFTLQYATRLTAPSWTDLPAPSPWPSAATEWTGTRPSPDAAYFRLVISEIAARGTVVSNLPLRVLDLPVVNALWQARLVPGTPDFPVSAWRLVYRTVDPAGRPTVASALVVIPDGAPRDLPLVSYQHGTVTQRQDVPSRLNPEADLGLILASSGYLMVLPDYLGLGDSPGFHPYHHAATHASAVVDALRAVRSLLGREGPYAAGWNGQLFLTGYSQGGHATLAAQRELELHHASELPLTASAPCAGAYDLSGTMADDLFSNRLPPNPYYAAYLLDAYLRLYPELGTPAEILRTPYSTTIPPLFDGTRGSGEINGALPARPADLLRPEVLEAFRTQPDHPIRRALRVNDLHTGWVPRIPTRLIHCPGDQDVLYANSTVAGAAFKAAGAAQVEVINPFPFGTLDHGGCVPFALLNAKFWFDTLRR